jgi:hypothetical protein
MKNESQDVKTMLLTNGDLASYIHVVTLNRNLPVLAPVPPHSRMFSRGSLGEDIDGRSKEGRFIRRVESELTQHIGGAPNFAQALLIRRCARGMLPARAFGSEDVRRIVD